MGNLNHLFEPIQIGTMQVKNRIKMAAMGIHYPELINSDGSYTERGIEYFIERAKGGVGLITTGAMQVQNQFEADAHGTTISSAGQAYIDGMKPLTKGVHKYGAKIVTQLVLEDRIQYGLQMALTLFLLVTDFQMYGTLQSNIVH